MASVGSVELELLLNRTAFDKDLASLSKLEIPPLNLDVKLDAKSLNKQLKDLKAGDYGCLELEICPDIKGLSRKLKELPKSLVDCIPVAICPELDTESLKKQFEAIKNEFSLSLQTAVSAAVKVSATGESKQGEAANRGADRASEKIEAGFGKAAEKINEAIDTSLRNAVGAIAAPFAGVFRGFFEGIGQNLSRELSNGAIRSFQKSLDISFKGVGGQAGGFAAKEVGKALGLETIPKPRKKRDDDESGGTGAPRKTPPKPSAPESGVSKELTRLASELGTFADIMRRAGLGGDKFGSSALGAAKEALELAATFEGLRQAIVAKKAVTTPTATTGSELLGKNPLSQNVASPSKPDIVQTDTTIQTSKRGFLKGDVTKVTKEEAKAQVEKVRSRLEKDLAELQSLPESATTTKKIEGLVKKISQLQSRIALDIANPEIPKAVRQSLGQLKSTQSKLAETQRSIEAIAAKSTSNRKLPGIVKAAAGGLGASILSAGSAFAAPTGSAGLGALGALPFDPTLGLATGGIAAAFAAAKFTPRILRKVAESRRGDTPSADLFKRGAQKAADVLETNIGELVKNSLKNFKLPNLKNLYNNSNIVRGLTNLTSKIQGIILPQINLNSIKKNLYNNSNIVRGITSLQSAVSGVITNPLKSLFSSIKDSPVRSLPAGGRIPSGELLTRSNATTKLMPRLGREYSLPKAGAQNQPTRIQSQPTLIQSLVTKLQNASPQNQQTRLQPQATLIQSLVTKLQNASPQNQQTRLQSQATLIQSVASQLRKTLIPGVQPTRVTVPPLAPNAPTSYWERFFRGLETRFYRSPLFSGNVSPKNRRNLTSEASGFLFSGALLAAPGATTAALGAPLIAALTPLITTLGLVASAIGPLVGTIANTLKQIEPLQKRFEFVSGGKEQGQAQQQFVRGVTDQLNIPVLSSLDQFSRLAAAARKTKLEGEPLKELFTGIATGAKALQLNAEDLNLVMFAFTQVLSKGKLSAEEVRLQIAERLPGAVGIFARAIGVTEAEFNKLLESGSLLAEDVLPKVGRQLKLEYGAAAAAASNTFLSSLTKVENAIFKLQEGFANSLAPLLTIVTDTFGNILNFFADNAKVVFSTSAVVLTGVAAQFFVGLTQILEASGLVGKLTGFLSPLFARVFATLTPFAVGILADFLDDIFGAQTSVIENLTKGSYNAVVSVILVVNDLKNAIGDVFASIPKSDFLPGLGEALNGIGQALTFVKKAISGTPIEFVSLFLILSQTFVLAKQGLNLVLARLGTTIAELSVSFVASVRSGKVFSSTLQTLTAGLNLTQLAVVGVTAALVLFFAKADFSDELGTKFDELGDRVTANLDRISEKLKQTGKDLDKLPGQLPEFKSKGFDLTVGLGDVFGKGAFRSDDLIKQIRNLKRESSSLKELGIGSILGSINPALQSGFNAITPQTRTFAEGSFTKNLDKLADKAKEFKKTIDITGIFSQDFDNTAGGKSLAQVNRFDEQIKNLQGRRGELLTGPKANTDEVKKQVADIDNLIAAFLKKRGEISKPIEDIRDTVLQATEVVQGYLEEINKSDVPEAAKEKARKSLQPTVDLVESAKKRLEELGAIDLSPLGNEFTQVTAEIEKSDRALEKTLGKIQLNTTKRLTKTATDLQSGTITPDVAARENTDSELADLKARGRSLDSFVKTRKESIKQLQAVPAPTTEQIESIDKYQKDVESKELELAQNRLQIANKITEGKKQSEGRILKDFQTANAQAIAVVEQAEAGRIERIKRRQLAGQITDEQAQLDISDAGVSKTKADLQTAKNALIEFQGIKKTGRISAEEIATREIELNKQISVAILQSLDAEIAKRDSLKQKRIADVEELRAKEQSSIDIARTNAANRIKQQQLAGIFTPDEAANANTEAEIAAAIGSLAIARKRLDDIKKLRAEGTLNAKEAAQKEKEAVASVAIAEGQILDLRLQKQQQFREQNLRRIEEANQRAIALIESSQAQSDIAVLNRQVDSPRSEDSDRASERALAFNAAEATRKKIVQAQKEIGGLSRANFETEAEYIAKRTELNSNLTSLVKEGLEQQLQKQRQVQEDAIRAIDRRIEAQKNQSDLAVQGLEDEKTALDLLNSSLDRSKQLLESRSSLNKAIADAAVVRAEIALEQAPDNQQLSLNLQNAKLEALRQEQQTSRDLLQLDLKRQKLSAEMAISEAEIAQSRALIARLEAVGELEKAERTSNNQAIAAAQTRLELQDKIVAATDKQLQNAKDNLSIQDELAANADKTLNIQQQSALAQAQAARSNGAANLSPVSPALSSPSTSGETDLSGKKPKKLSLFEQSRLNIFAPLPTNKNVGLPPEYFNLKAVTQKAAASPFSTGGTSAEAELNLLAGLKPGESVENLLKRQMGLDPSLSAEAFDRLPKNLFFGQDREGTLEGLNQKYAPKANSLQQLQEMYKPKASSLDQLQEIYKTDARSFEELNQKYAPKESSSAQFTDSLKAANKDVVDRLDKLNQTVASAINSPRSLYVSSPEPITDAVSILADLNRMNIQSSGLG